AHLIVEGGGNARRDREVHGESIAYPRDVEQQHLPLYASHCSIVFDHRAMKGHRAEAAGQREKDAGQDENTHREGLLRQALRTFETTQTLAGRLASQLCPLSSSRGALPLRSPGKEASARRAEPRPSAPAPTASGV